MNAMRTSYSLTQRVLHWVMAALILAMLFIGVGMVATVSGKHQWLLAIHKPLGIAILLLAIVRLFVRLRNPSPPLPSDLPGLQRIAAHLSHWLLYALMIAMPLLGWAMLSAGGSPVMLASDLRLPAILPENALAFAWLRTAHGVLAYLLFFVFLAHLGAALYHALIRRDGVLRSMLGAARSRAEPASPDDRACSVGIGDPIAPTDEA
ncbi:cytochrome b [Luteimonas marina]|uniref:Cytochrome b n=1 Tax=Luteimonas marina TaxID=488485 RepID=A0A5C5TZN8_9GAMM|nr:cytochrome b [Luteimonas marina]TWT19167.1 cytochrome b [Luteimonas marina]